MRIVDSFTEALLFARKFCRGELEAMSVEQVRVELQNRFDTSRKLCTELGIPDTIYEAAKFPVVALVDEMLQTSNWVDKAAWAKNPLQRIYFNTTNAGADFYERMNVLNKFGPERDVREVYALCLGLGFRGRFFRGEDREHYERIKAFNLGLLLHDEAERNIDSATLFPFAYKASDARNDNPFKSRFSIYPIIFGVPLLVLILMIGFYHLNIAWVLDEVQALVNF